MLKTTEAISFSLLPKLEYFSSHANTEKKKKKKKRSSQRMITSHHLFSIFFPLRKLIPHTQKLTLNITTQERRIATLFKSLDELVLTFLDLPLRSSIDPKHILSGNFAPVDELPPTACEVVEGSIPDCLHGGAYIRNGPNTQILPPGPYHLFDGDGMLHMITVISRDEATFCSRYIKTYKYIVEHKLGHPIFPSVFASFNGIGASIVRSLLTVARVVTRQFDPITNGFGSANISVALIGRRMFALGEADLPYEIRVTSDGDIVTLGRHNFFSDEPFLSMTAHPKIDPETGEVFSLRYHVVPPYLTLFRIDADRKKQRLSLPILSMKSTSLTHDFALTRNYVVFPDTQIVMEFMEIARGRPPARVDMAKLPRLGVIPRYADDESELVWIDAPGLNMVHCFNAWEENDGETIIMVASNPSCIDQALERLDLALPRLEKIVINVRTKTLRRHLLSNEVLDMGVINPTYAGKRSRYLYVGKVAEPMMLVGVVKIDLCVEDAASCTVASRLYGPNCSGSEPFFVPREPNNPAAEEDDGYLVAYIHDENTQESRFLVMDAKSPTLETVAAVKLPGRVPTGFHGLFVRESDLNKL